MRGRECGMRGSVALALLTLFWCGSRGEADVVGHWLFDADHVSGGMASDLAGDFDATIHGSAQLTSNPDALILDGSDDYLAMGEDVGNALPARDISVEAWVWLDTGTEWGGIIGYIQDNGADEHGWLLGYDSTRFSFALADGSAMTYLKGTTEFDRRAWTHVVGTYDGETMTLYVNGRAESSSTVPSGDISYRAASYVIGVYHDDNEHYPLDGRLHEIRVDDSVLTPGEVLARYEAKKDLFTDEPPDPPPGPAISLGPYVEFTGQGVATVHWEMPTLSPSIVEYGRQSISEHRVEEATPRRVHALDLTGLKRDTEYQYRIVRTVDGSEVQTDAYTLETHFNFCLPDVPDRPSPYPADATAERYAQAAERILAASGVSRGYCLVLGSHHGQLQYELAKRSELMMVGVDTDVARVDTARRALLRAGVYGPRATVRHVASYETLPFTKHFANLIVSDHMMATGECIGHAGEVDRLLRPGGGVACFGQPEGEGSLDASELTAWLDGGGLTYTTDANSGIWARVVCEPLAGAADWTHQYGGADNAACNEDTLQDATGVSQMAVQWIGRPGGDAVMDRNPRKPAPLASNGRLFLQGFNRIITMDAYNGAILWSLEVPDLRRTNIPRDASNWCADANALHAAIGDTCWRLDAATGELTGVENVADDPSPDGQHDWGYVASVDGRLLGSSAKTGSSYTAFWGHSSWYDQKTGYGTWKVCSDDLFAVDQADGRRLWRYTDGSIINSTITVGGERVYFVESRNPAVMASASGRMSLPELWQDQFLVALDIATGHRVWQTPVDTVDGTVVFFLGYTGTPAETLVLGLSGTNYHLYAFDATNGTAAWHVQHAWPNDNHGGHMQHPVLRDGKAYLWPRVYRVQDGVRVSPDMPGREGCPTFAAGARVFAYRGSGRIISLWDAEENRTAGWTSIRPGCWLSVIPASGMILAPEGGSGCSCGGWLQTSIGYSRKE